jgi:ankyrin repeat protein
MDDPKNAPWGSVATRFDPIHSAARERNVGTIRELLSKGVDVDSLNGRAANGDGGNTPLWFAAQGAGPNGLDVARALIEAGADVNRQCEHGRTPLHMAAAWGHLDVVTFLMDNGADPTIRDEEGMTPARVAREGYKSNRVTADERREVRQYFDSLGID